MKANRNNILQLYIILALLIFNTSVSLAQEGPLAGKQATSLDALEKMLYRPDDSLKVVALKLLCWEFRNSDPAKAVEYGEKAVKISIALNLNFELADSYNRLGIAYRNTGKYAQALECYFKGMEISKVHGYENLLAFQFNNLADLYSRLELYDRAKEFGKKALEIGQKIKDDYTLSYIYNILGTIYRNQNILDSALSNFTLSLELRKKIGFSPGIATANLNIGRTLLQLGQYDSSLKYLNVAADIYADNNDLQGMIIVNLQRGLLYNRIGKFDKAISFFKKSLEINQKFGDYQVARDAHRGLGYSYSKLGNWSSAYSHLDQSVAINDSITLSQFVERLTQLTETLRFEETLNLQKEKEKVLAERLSLQRSLIRLYAAIIILLTLLVGLAIFFYIKRSKDVRLLQAQKEEINNLNHAKDRFFSILAHDLKNQLTSMVTIAHMVKEKSIELDDDKLINLSKRLYALGFSTNDLLDNVLSWIKVQNKQVEVKSTPVKLKQLVDKVIYSQQPAADMKQVTIQNKVPSDLIIDSDPDRLSTIVRNLLSNAIKFSNISGKVEIEASTIGNHLEVNITDYGVGIPEEKLNNLFSAREIESNPGTLEEQGSGIGLMICRNLANDLKGSIRVSSQIHKGSTFTIILPLKGDTFS